MSAYKQHALSAIFPPLPDDEFAELVEDLKTHGLRNPIVLFEGQILDGWNRYQGCVKARINPLFTTYGGKDPASYVRAQNLLHRHLDPSQRAAAIVALSEWQAGGRPKTSPDSKTSLNSEPQTNAQMATAAGVSERQVSAAKVVHAKGTLELKEAVRKGEIPVQRAATIAALPAKQQPAAMKAQPAPKARPQEYDLQSRFDALCAAHQELRDAHAAMGDELATCTALIAGNEAAAAEMNKLRETLRVTQLQRDQYMRQVEEMRKQLGIWKRKAEKAAA